MIMERKDRYFYPTMYNMVRVVNRLAEIVESEGGTVERHEDDDVLVHLRDTDREVRDIEPDVKTKFVSLISDLWIRFELNGFKYYFEVQSNPYFPDGYTKTPVDWKGESYIDKIEMIDKSWMFNDIVSRAADEETIGRAAVILLDQLETAPDSRKYD